MITGIGTDIMEIAQIKELISASEKFIRYVFTPTEIEYCEQQPCRYQHYAARYAAKEALMKALGTGWDSGVQWKDIEIIRHQRDVPSIHLHNKTKIIAKEIGIEKIWVSLSHSGEYAMATVVLEKL